MKDRNISFYSKSQTLSKNHSRDNNMDNNKCLLLVNQAQSNIYPQKCCLKMFISGQIFKIDTSIESCIIMLLIWQGNELCTLSGHSDRVLTVACTDNGTIATAALDKSVRIWQPPSEDGSIKSQGHDAEVTCAVFSANGKMLLTSSRLVLTLDYCFMEVI